MANAKAAKDTEEYGDFAAFISSSRPKTNAELSEELNKLVAAVRDTGKAGSIQLTIVVKPLDGGVSVLSVNDQIKVKRPERNREASIAYPDHNNNLSRRDPSSMPLFDDDIRDAPTTNLATGEVKDVPNS